MKCKNCEKLELVNFELTLENMRLYRQLNEKKRTKVKRIVGRLFKKMIK